MKSVRRNAPKRPGGSEQEDNKQWRVFCAIDMPDMVGDLLSKHIQSLQRQASRVSASWGRMGKFHLTLKFLGSISQNRITDVSRAAQLATETIKPFKITIGGTGVFPKHGPPRVLWIGIQDSTGTIEQLQKRLEEECATVGFEAEERQFQPHLTIARLRDREGTRDIARAHLDLGFPPFDISVNELRVYRSQLGSEGSQYSVISTHSFAP